MNKILWILLGGSLGALSRYGFIIFSQKFFSANFPWATFLINLLGGFVIGLLWQFFETNGHFPHIRIFLLTGFLGAFTTFSAYSLENFIFIKEGEYLSALVYILLSNILAIGFVFLGSRLAQLLFPCLK